MPFLPSTLCLPPRAHLVIFTPCLFTCACSASPVFSCVLCLSLTPSPCLPPVIFLGWHLCCSSLSLWFFVVLFIFASSFYSPVLHLHASPCSLHHLCFIQPLYLSVLFCAPGYTLPRPLVPSISPPASDPGSFFAPGTLYSQRPENHCGQHQCHEADVGAPSGLLVSMFP